MNRIVETILPDTHVSFTDLCSATNISEDYVIELIDYDVIIPISGARPQEWQFNIQAVSVVSKAARLHRDLDITWADMALVLDLLEDINKLKDENRQLKQQISRLLTVSH